MSEHTTSTEPVTVTVDGLRYVRSNGQWFAHPEGAPWRIPQEADQSRMLDHIADITQRIAEAERERDNANITGYWAARQADEAFTQLTAATQRAERDAQDAARWREARSTRFGLADWGNPYAKPVVLYNEQADAAIDAAILHANASTPEKP